MSKTSLGIRERHNFGKIPAALELPNLIAIQRESFELLINDGLKEVFNEISPIQDFTGNLQVEFKNHGFGEAKLTPFECKEKHMTYSAPLNVTVKFVNKETDEIKEQTVFMGDFPMMTDKGTFIINGTERVIVSQLVRSPGIYFSEELDKTTDKIIHIAKIIPSRGAWLEFETDGETMYTRIDRKRKQPVTMLMKAFGFVEDKDIYKKISDNSVIKSAFSKDPTISREEALIDIYRRIRPGEPPSVESAKSLIESMFFNPHRYDLAKVGRYKANKKLELNVPLSTTVLTFDDIYATIKYLAKLAEGEGIADDIDHFGNRRIRPVGELIQNQFRIGISRMERVVRERMNTLEVETITPQALVNIKPVVASLKEFFGSSQLSQFMDQTNPIAGLTHKRRLSALGPGGLSRERAGFEVRDVHPSHYGRMCPIETPEGPNIGLIGTLSSYGRINKFGFIETPYRKVEKGVVTKKVDYLTADEEDKYIVAQANAPFNEKTGKFTGDSVLVRMKNEVSTVPPKEVDYMDVSPMQIISVATSLIPFLEHNDANRALMGTNMQRQAVPLLITEAPFVGTGIEQKIVKDTGEGVLANNDGTVTDVCADFIEIKTKKGKEIYYLQKFNRSNQGTCTNQKPFVEIDQKVKAGQVIVDGASTEKGELALGKNILVAFMSWDGYNFEDAIIVSERLVKDDVLTSIHIEEHEVAARETKLGPEEITRDIPNVSEELLKDLDDDGVIIIGAEVTPGDILVGKVTAKGETELTAEERLLRAIFGEKAREVRDTSLKVPHGESGTVIGVKVFSREKGDELSPGVLKLVRIYIAQKRKVSEGDKLAGRHGNKGVISKILPIEDMPYLEDGTHVDLILNPLGVPSRMNIGQVLEAQLGWAAKEGFNSNNGKKSIDYVLSPAFHGATEDEIKNSLEKAGLPRNGKIVLYDGRTGEPFDEPISIGYLYMLKLNHLVDDKIHARSTGPYSLVTQQPLGGKAQFGGQRFGEMEVWALEAYGAAYTLQELLTVKSDDVLGRVRTYEAIVKGENIPEAGIPESFKVLVKEMQSLGFNVDILSDEGKEISLEEGEDDIFSTAEELGIDLHGEAPKEEEPKEILIEESVDEIESEGDKPIEEIVNIKEDEEEIEEELEDKTEEGEE